MALYCSYHDIEKRELLDYMWNKYTRMMNTNVKMRWNHLFDNKKGVMHQVILIDDKLVGELYEAIGVLFTY